MTEDDDRLIMVVDVTARVLRHIRSTGTYPNLSGHEVDFIAFISQQGTFVAEVLSMQKGIRLNQVYKEFESKGKTTLYTVGPLSRINLRRNSKIPRGRKRVVPYVEFMSSENTSSIFRHHRDLYPE